jgi:acyl-CoA reductase-like NAD-dependent aldehyde dehydrogenase
MTRVDVRKTYKLYIGGAFPRSESGRSYPVTDAKGRLLANAAQASRKDVRDAVRAARGALPGWSGTTAYNRGQVLYRVAELLQGRRAQFVVEVQEAEGGRATAARAAVVGVIAPQESSLLGLVSVLAPPIACGNTVVVLASQDRPLPAISLAEVLGTSDVPGGVVNMLTGVTAELAPWLAGHRDVNALDLTGVSGSLRVDLQRSAADTVKRVHLPRDDDWTDEPGIDRLAAFVETKTVWHPIGV